MHRIAEQPNGSLQAQLECGFYIPVIADYKLQGESTVKREHMQSELGCFTLFFYSS